MSGIEFHGIVTLCGIQAEVGTSLKVIARPPLAKDAELSKVLGVDDEEAVETSGSVQTQVVT